MQENPLTLSELNGLIRNSIKQAIPDAYWITAEIAELKVNYSGHCYLELVEKNSNADTLKAKARATIWSSVFRMLKPYFETTTRTSLTTGLKIMVKVTVEFHELYGLSLNITDIEPRFTMGEMARQKLEVIDRLMSEGVFDLNRQQEIPRLPQKIAVISSKTAAGFGDFQDQLLHNPNGYAFYIKLFPSVMQGEEAEKSIVTAMEKVFRYEDIFDVLVIIRGGGAQSDLSCFNGYWLASHIAQFSLPVLTGIGHEQDETVADMVAHTRLKTPTAVAEFLLAIFQEEENLQNSLSAALIERSRIILNEQSSRLMKMVLSLKPLLQAIVASGREKLSVWSVMLKHASQAQITRALNRFTLLRFSIGSSSKHFFLGKYHSIHTTGKFFRNSIPAFLKQHANKLELLASKNHYNDPQHILKRGYSITLFQGKPVTSSAILNEGDVMDTLLSEGKIKSKVIEKDKGLTG
jgi:exodeoxyribonuclease VII large subunit